MEFRIEHDTMGEVKVPKDALYSAQTQRAVENFPISGSTLEKAHIAALAQIKKAAALADWFRNQLQHEHERGFGNSCFEAPR
jgi:fumarate hydratase class II